MKLYKLCSFGFTVIFAAVGLMFLFFPEAALMFFNNQSDRFGLPRSPVQGAGFYLTLAVAYMYLVTLLAWLMVRHPAQRIYPVLLANGKLASAAVSIYLFLMHQPYLIYFANFATDGLIGLAVLYLLRIQKAEARVCC